MPERTTGGLFLPDAGALAMLEQPRPQSDDLQGEGVRIEAGWASPYFVTDPSTWHAELDRPALVLLEHPLDSVAALVPLCEHAAAAATPLVLVAPAFTAEVLALLVVNKLRGILLVNAIATPRLPELAAQLELRPWPSPPVELSSVAGVRRVVSAADASLFVR
ncbi:MAG: hypothetical protein ACOZQL_23610 [Myxococcota bacterium]